MIIIKVLLKFSYFLLAVFYCFSAHANNLQKEEVSGWQTYCPMAKGWIHEWRLNHEEFHLERLPDVDLDFRSGYAFLSDQKVVYQNLISAKQYIFHDGIFTRVNSTEKVDCGAFTHGEYTFKHHSEDGKVQACKTKSPSMCISIDIKPPDGYEAQSMANFCGDLFVGYWPHGEILRRDSETGEWSLFARLFSEPSKDESFIPYSNRPTDIVDNSFYGQRITALVPYEDALYIATSNLRGWGSHIKPSFLSKEKISEYGAAYKITAQGCMTYRTQTDE